MLGKNPLKLVMEFHKRSGRFRIESEDRRLVRFPTEKQIAQIWRNVFPSSSFFVGSGISMPVTGFDADVGSGTKAKDRKKFCDALALECEVM